MGQQTQRSRRVGELLQRELAVMVRDQLKDPRLGLVTVAAVEVSRDLAHARVFVTFTDPATDTRASVAALQHAAGFLRRQLSGRVELRTVPALRFVHDESLDRGFAMDRLIADAVAADDAAAQQRDDD